MSKLDRALARMIRRSTDVAYRSTDVNPANQSGGYAMAMPGAWTGKDQPLYETFSSMNAVEEGYFGNMYIYRAVQVMAQSISALPLRAGRNKDSQFNLLSPLAELLGPEPGSPNPSMSSQQMIEFLLVQYIVMGKCAMVISRDPYTNEINGLFPLLAQWLNPVPGTQTGGTEYFKEFWYGQRGTPSFKVFQPDEIVYIWKPSQSNLRQPESFLRAGRLTVSVAQMLDQFDYAFLKSGMALSTIVVTPAFAEPEMARAFKDSLNSEFSGPTSAGKTLFLEMDNEDTQGNARPTAAVQVERLAPSPHDAQQALARDAKIKDIVALTGVPLSLIGDASSQTYANADQEYENFVLHRMRPLAEDFMNHLNNKLSPLLGTGRDVGWWDYSDITVLQPVSPFAAYTRSIVELLQMNVLDRDEFRQSVGLPEWIEIDPNDERPLIIPSTAAPGVAGQPVAKATEEALLPPAAVPTALAANPPQLAPPSAEDNVGDPGTPIAAARSYRAMLRHAGPDGHVPIPGGHVHEGSTPDHKKGALETVMTKSLRNLMDEQARYAQSRFAGVRGQRAAKTMDRPAQWYDENHWQSRTREAIALFTDDPEVIDSLAGDITRSTRQHLTVAVLGMAPNLLSDAVARAFDASYKTAMELARAALEATELLGA